MGDSPLHQLPRIMRTSDIVGYHTQRSTVTQLNLIRTRIQERCRTSHELQQSLRRIKPSESKFITPSDFRVILVKFGVNLTPDELREIFAEFDSSNTGKIDFNSFARWVTTDAKPQRFSESAVQAKNEKQIGAIHSRLACDIKQLPSILRYDGSKAVDFDTLLSAFSQISQRALSDKDLRTVFRVLDVGNVGSIQLSTLLDFAKTGQAPNANTISKTNIQKFDSSGVPALSTCITRVCGISTNVLAKCFERMPRNSPLVLHFDEFKSMLHSEGLGANKKDAENLFMALGGDENNSADIALLLDNLRRMEMKQQQEAKKLLANSKEKDKQRRRREVADYTIKDEPKQAQLGTRSGVGSAEDRRRGSISSPSGQRQNSAAKRIDHAITLNTQRADRLFREALRRCYKVMKEQLKMLDTDNSGYVSPEQLRSAINQHCISLTLEDFRYIIQNVKTDPSNRINWHHFLQLYHGKSEGHGHARGSIHDHKASTQPTQNFSTANLNSSSDCASPRNGSSSVGALPAAKTSEGDQHAARMKKGWQKLLKACQQKDVDRRGVVHADDFVSALERTGLEKMLSGSTREQLVNKFIVDRGQNLLDYVNLIRKFLLEAANEPPVPKGKIFQPKMPTTSRQLKPSHPWEFDYLNAANTNSSLPAIQGASVPSEQGSPDKTPYWKQACAKPREDFKTEILNPRFPRGKEIHALQLATGGYSPQEAAKYLSKFDTKMLMSIRDVHAAMLPHSKRLYQELRAVAQPMKKSQRMSHVPLSMEVVTKSFKEVFDNVGVGVRRGSLLMVAQIFRGKGMPEVVRVDEMLAAMKMLKEADERNGYVSAVNEYDY